MIKKIENCIYCGEKMESITAKKKYCSAKCRLYFNRERKKAIIVAEPVIKSIKVEKTISNTKNTITTVETAKNAKEMPNGLSIMDQIQWKIDNL
jgi:predicted nucleic acid-binding Zn ribbon protein